MFPTFPTHLLQYSVLPSWRVWNHSLDALYYDVGRLTPWEHQQLSPLAAPEGSIVVAPPSQMGEPLRTLTVEEFVQLLEGRQPQPVADALVVAGVGSSALGTAALARNVADYLGRPVAGVVSGFGLADAFSEALGGWFFLGTDQALRSAVDPYLCAVGETAPAHRPVQAKAGSPAANSDASALVRILRANSSAIRLLVGHSKGNYLIESALACLIQESHPHLPLHHLADLHVVTLGGAVVLPKFFTHARQVLGALDAFGHLNSRPGVATIAMPNTCHTLNSALPLHMSVAKALQLAGIPAGR